MQINLMTKIAGVAKDNGQHLTIGEVFITALRVPAVLDTVALIQYDLHKKIESALQNKTYFVELSLSECHLIADLAAIAYSNNDRIPPLIYGQVHEIIAKSFAAEINIKNKNIEMPENIKESTKDINNDNR